MTSTLCCRLCDGLLSHRFNLMLLAKHDVAFYECHDCLSLQTEPPYWLGEAYERSLSDLDTGAAQRVLRNLSAAYSVARLFHAKNIIDLGGGDGLLCRFLRDFGMNCYVQDKYAQPAYAQGFTIPDFARPDMVLAFEVLEHFQDPNSELDAVFGGNPALLVISTCLYTGQAKDWWYLAPEGGQHIFLYSRKALQLIAKRYGYNLVVCGTCMVFTKEGSLTAIKSVLARLLLSRYASRIVRAILVMSPTPGVWKDHLLQKEKRPTNMPS